MSGVVTNSHAWPVEGSDQELSVGHLKFKMPTGSPREI